MFDPTSMIPIVGSMGPAAASVASGPPGWLAAAPMILQGLSGLFGGGKPDRTMIQPPQPRTTPAGPWTGIQAGLGGGYR